MPKRRLAPELEVLEHQLVETMIAGLKAWRPDLSYPESHSDMEACARAVLRMFEVRRLGLARELEYLEVNQA